MVVVVVWAAAGRLVAAVRVAAVVLTVRAQVAERHVREVVVPLREATRLVAVVAQVTLGLVATIETGAMVKSHP